MRNKISTKDRFWSKIEIRGEDECWEWKKCLNEHGYGVFRHKGISQLSNRMTWFIVKGRFPSSCVLHKCDNRKCCNPSHLFLGTRKDNAVDMVSKKRNKTPFGRGEEHIQSVLKEEDVVNVLRLFFSDKIKKKKISEITGIKYSGIMDITLGRNWKDVYEKYIFEHGISK